MSDDQFDEFEDFEEHDSEEGVGSSPFAGVVNEEMAQKIQQVSATVKTVTAKYGTEKVLIGAVMVCLLAGGAIYLSNQGGNKK